MDHLRHLPDLKLGLLPRLWAEHHHPRLRTEWLRLRRRLKTEI